VPFDFLHHFFRVPDFQRRAAEGNIVEDFREDASQAEHYAGAELRIARQSHDQFAPAFDHLLHQYAAFVTFHAGQNFTKRFFRFRGRSDIDVDQPFFGLVGNVRGAALHHQRKADFLQAAFQAGLVFGQNFFCNRDAVRGQDLFGLVFRKRFAPLLQGLLDDPVCLIVFHFFLPP